MPGEGDGRARVGYGIFRPVEKEGEELRTFHNVLRSNSVSSLVFPRRQLWGKCFFAGLSGKLCCLFLRDRGKLSGNARKGCAPRWRLEKVGRHGPLAGRVPSGRRRTAKKCLSTCGEGDRFFASVSFFPSLLSLLRGQAFFRFMVFFCCAGAALSLRQADSFLWCR